MPPAHGWLGADRWWAKYACSHAQTRSPAEWWAFRCLAQGRRLLCDGQGPLAHHRASAYACVARYAPRGRRGATPAMVRARLLAWRASACDGIAPGGPQHSHVVVALPHEPSCASRASAALERYACRWLVGLRDSSPAGCMVRRLLGRPVGSPSGCASRASTPCLVLQFRVPPWQASPLDGVRRLRCARWSWLGLGVRRPFSDDDRDEHRVSIWLACGAPASPAQRLTGEFSGAIRAQLGPPLGRRSSAAGALLCHRSSGRSCAALGRFVVALRRAPTWAPLRCHASATQEAVRSARMQAARWCAYVFSP